MNRRSAFYWITVVMVLVTITGCDEGGGINFFTLEQDKQFGRDFDKQITSDTSDYQVLDANQYSEAYQHLTRIRNELLQSPDLIYADEFEWKVRILKNDTTLNAFCVPGGYMYFYTGLIKYLDNEAQFAGVMAHEMAHADKRHVTRRMTQLYGFQFLLGFILGENPDAWAQIAAELALGLGNLQFSRSDEYQADEYAVKYSDDTELYPKGVAGFFEKMQSGNTPWVPVFLRTHPPAEDRVEAINQVWMGLGSPGGGKYPDRYQLFINSLP